MFPGQSLPLLTLVFVYNPFSKYTFTGVIHFILDFQEFNCIIIILYKEILTKGVTRGYGILTTPPCRTNSRINPLFLIFLGRFVQFQFHNVIFPLIR